MCESTESKEVTRFSGYATNITQIQLYLKGNREKLVIELKLLLLLSITPNLFDYNSKDSQRNILSSHTLAIKGEGDRS